MDLKKHMFLNENNSRILNGLKILNFLKKVSSTNTTIFVFVKFEFKVVNL